MKNFVQIVFPLSLLLFTNSLNAQVAPFIKWQKCFGGSGGEGAYSIQQTIDGGFILAGSSWSNDGDVSGNHGGNDYWIVKLDADGDVEWQKSLGGSEDDGAQSIQQTTDGGYIIAGTSQSNDNDVTGNHGFYNSYGNLINTIDYWIVKLSNDGNLVWQKSFGGTEYDQANSVLQTTDGGFIVAGTSRSNDGDVSGNHLDSLGYQTIDSWIVKLDTDGNLVWQKSLGGSEDDGAYSIEQTTDGGFIIAGNSNSNDGDVSVNHGYYDYYGNLINSVDDWIMKLDITGNLVWEKSLGGSNVDRASDIQQTSDGGFIVAGWTYSNDGDVSGNHGSGDCWIVKLDIPGNIVWQKSLGGINVDAARSVQQTNDGGYIVAGVSESDDGDVSGNHGIIGSSDYWIVKLDAIGNLIWQECLGGSGNDYAWDIQQTSDDGFIVAGLSLSNDGNISGNHGYYDCWIVKLTGDTLTGVASPSTKSISFYPNPVESQLWFNLTMPASEATIRVYDLQGRIRDCGLGLSNFGWSKSIQLNIENLPEGFYTIHIINNKTGRSEVGKFVKVQ